LVAKKDSHTHTFTTSGREVYFKSLQASHIFLHLAQLWFNFDKEIINPQMPSIIEGYSYDIFISYRQKDNKRDGWVTEFVDNLKGKLASTFKE
jgi:hypothetical protein